MGKGKKGGGKKRFNPIGNLGKHAHPKKRGRGKKGKGGKSAPMMPPGMPSMGM